MTPSGRQSGWLCRGRVLPVFERVHVMGVLNVTPDSFSDGGRFTDPEAACRWALEMVSGGADIIDIGGESTRPGAEPVEVHEEIRRVIPVIEKIAAATDIPISIDTTKSEVAGAALEAGAAIVNDVSAMRFDSAMAPLVAVKGAGLVLMHMLGEPRNMQRDPSYGDVVAEVTGALSGWAAAAEAAGIARESIALDPGIGFGKTLEHNLRLLAGTGSLAALGYPVLVGPSRKSFIGMALDVPVDRRLEGTAAAVAWLAANGANIIRVHDVAEMARVIRMTAAIAKVRP